MKAMRFVALILCCMLSVGITSACGKAPRQEQELEYDCVFNMGEYEFFSDIFDGGQWEEKGLYTVLLKGCYSPVVLEMDGLTVKTVSAYGQTLQLDQDTYQDQVGIEIEASDGILIVYQMYDYEKTCWLITKEKTYSLPPIDGYSTTVHVRDDGSLEYYQSWSEYETTFNQEKFAPLYCCTSRDHVLYQIGSVNIKDGNLNLKLEKKVTLADEYDVDELFAQAKADEYAGEYFSSFETADEALAANLNRG